MADDGRRAGVTTSTAPRLPLAGRYVDHLRAERGLAANTVVAYQRDLALYARYLGEVGVADPRPVSPQQLESFDAWLRGDVPLPL
jgi:integrase/recombinase XerD